MRKKFLVTNVVVEDVLVVVFCDDVGSGLSLELKKDCLWWSTQIDAAAAQGTLHFPRDYYCSVGQCKQLNKASATTYPTSDAAAGGKPP